MKRPADLPLPDLTLEEIVLSTLMATSEAELIRTSRYEIWSWASGGSPYREIARLVPPGMFVALGRPRTFSKLIAAVRRQMKAGGLVEVGDEA